MRNPEDHSRPRRDRVRGYERGAGGQERVELFADDFSRFPPGSAFLSPMGQLNGAIQEYHYIEHRGVQTRTVAQPDRAS